MARPRTQTDEDILSHVMAAFLQDGARGASFRQVAARTGLAPATLVGRFASQEAMIRAALVQAWARHMAALEAAIAGLRGDGKGAQALLKALTCPEPQLLAASHADPALSPHAEAWRQRLVEELSARLRDGEAGSILFAAWFGRQSWTALSGKGFALGEAVRRLSRG